MFQISQDFAPPFKLIAPFFIIGSIFYLLSVLSLFGFHVDNFHHLDVKMLSFIHLFLLGFVMMIIFGAMAQLVPVVLEVGHFAVELFYAIWPLLGIGTLMMVFGFLYLPTLLPYGGSVVLIAMMIFVFEIFLTMRKVQKFNVVMSSIFISNTFLFFGIIFGLAMALSYAGTLDLDLDALLRSHVYLVIGGYVTITLMGLSTVLLPMFGLSHGFTKKLLNISISLMSSAVVLVVISSFYDMLFIKYTAYVLAIFSLLVYFYLVYQIYTTRARKENDIYVKSMMLAYSFMLMSLVFGLLYLITSKESFLLVFGWLLVFGFFGFAITGHIYKIVPFLVWFERFSPLVGKKKVPMLADMLPKQSSHAQMTFTAIGVVLITLALLFNNDLLINAGASFLVFGAIAFIRTVIYMINYKKGTIA